LRMDAARGKQIELLLAHTAIMRDRSACQTLWTCCVYARTN
jgi:hypothetical protein